MKKIIKKVDEEKGIHQITIVDERWYSKEVKNSTTGVPEMKFVPSVTWITQSYPKGVGYYKWLAEHGWDEAESIKTQAGDKGTKVHLAIEDIMQGKEVRIDSTYINKSLGEQEELTLEECDAILSFLAWKKSKEEEGYIIETLTYESTVFSNQHNYAGTIDWIVKLTHKLSPTESEYWIIDFKTSQQVWPSHELQLNAYKRTLENGENIIKDLEVTNLHMGILQVGYRKNKAGWKFTEIENDFDMFLTAQKIWKKEHADESPKKRDYPIILSPEITMEEIVNSLPSFPNKKAKIAKK